MQHLEGSGTPVLYIGRTVLKGQVTDSATTSCRTATRLWRVLFRTLGVFLIVLFPAWRRGSELPYRTV